MKRDILAAITFLTTGLLLFLAQVEGPPQKVLSTGDEFGVIETVLVQEGAPETPKELLPGDPGTRDS